MLQANKKFLDRFQDDRLVMRILFGLIAQDLADFLRTAEIPQTRANTNMTEMEIWFEDENYINHFRIDI